MRAILQRVTSASVDVEGNRVGSIDGGWLVLLGVAKTDSDADLEYLIEKTANLRAFPDEHQKMNLSVQDVGGKILAVSQFTLYGDCRKGRRPSFTDAANPEMAKDYYEKYMAGLRSLGLTVESGTFQAMMSVSLINSGPVTFILDSSRQI